ncbi:MAG TPA: LuxR C-terminal-related transcriptional regulator [Streptosporangiaceae bacterium]|nr:LuxR C-terminal-related transcriptional regulator [Streptosporangiaceae bacterium]
MSELLDRATETAALEGVLAAVRDGLSGVLVLRGDAGIGKTVLLEWTARQAPDMQVARVAGIQAEMGMGFAGLHQLLVPFLSGLDGLPGPQRQALGTAFGLMDGPPSDRFLVGLAALTLLTDAAAGRPVLCLVDDAQWLDQVSVEVLGFVARRLYADQVGVLFTVREGEARAAALARLPELTLGGLPDQVAGELLTASAPAPVDGQVCQRIVAGVAGNPLALVEAAAELTPEELSGAKPLGWPLRFGGRLEELYLARVRALPADAQTLLLLAAADPTGDPALAVKAAEQLGVDPDGGETAGMGRLVSWQPQVRFRHPLIRSAAYYAASVGARRRAHQALAAVTDPDVDPDRRAWHLAEAAPGPDEQVAAELEGSAGRAQARGGLAAAAAFLERAAILTPDPRRRTERMLEAAQVNVQAGAFGKARDLLVMAEARPLDEFQAARADLLRGRIAFASGLGSDAPPLLLRAAKRLEPLDLDLARETYVDAWQAAFFAGHLAGAGHVLEVSRAARLLPAPAPPPRLVDLVLDGFALLVTEGPAAAAATLRRATSALASPDIPEEEILRWGFVATVADEALWDDEGWRVTVRQVQLARDVGALDQLSFLLNRMAVETVWSGDFAAATLLIAEAAAVREATGSRFAPVAAAMLAAFRGREAEAIPLIESIIEQAAAGGQGVSVTVAHWVAAVLYNGLGRYEEALAAARQASEHKHVYISVWALPELIEAASRTGNPPIASDALDLLAERTRAGGTDLGIGIEARSRALVSGEEAPEGQYQEAIGRLGHARRRPELARAHLLYGEWLRRQRRRRDARDQLRIAFEMFDSMGMEAFAGRARAELRATGERARPRGPGAPDVLTAQEEQIAQLVAEHLSNREIAARLFISASTVEYHLRKIFRKLGVSNRTQLARTLRNDKGIPAQQYQQ